MQRNFSSPNLNIKWPHTFLKVNKNPGSKKCQTDDAQNYFTWKKQIRELTPQLPLALPGICSRAGCGVELPCQYTGSGCLCATATGAALREAEGPTEAAAVAIWPRGESAGPAQALQGWATGTHTSPSPGPASQHTAALPGKGTANRQSHKRAVTAKEPRRANPAERVREASCANTPTGRSSYEKRQHTRQFYTLQ